MSVIRKFKTKKYVITFEKPVGYIDRFQVATNNIKKTKKEFDSYECIYTRKWTIDDVEPI